MSTALLLYPGLDKINLDTFDLGNGFRRSKKQDLHSVSSFALRLIGATVEGSVTTHQLLGPHVVQNPLCIFTIVPAFHDGQE